MCLSVFSKILGFVSGSREILIIADFGPNMDSGNGWRNVVVEHVFSLHPSPEGHCSSRILAKITGSPLVAAGLCGSSWDPCHN